MHADDEGLVRTLTAEQRQVHGLADASARGVRERLLPEVASALAGVLVTTAPSPLGAGWSSPLLVFVQHVPTTLLHERGWLRITPLTQAVGWDAPELWAVMAGGRPALLVQLEVEGRVDAAQVVLRRCRWRREVNALDVLELRELRRRGQLAEDADDAVLVEAAVLEAELGGGLLADWRPHTSADGDQAPRSLPGATRSRRTFAVAVSGVDGAGKSTTAARLEQDLLLLGIPVHRVWTRPGMGPAWLDRLAGLGKRLLRQGSEPGVRAAAAGQASHLRSRRGLVGWAWSTLVTVTFLRDLCSQRGPGRVTLYDRHVLDALATLEFAYAGVDLRLQRWLVRTLVPRAALIVYLDVPAEVAVARKPGDQIGDLAVRRQLAAYSEWQARLDLPVTALDGTAPPGELAERVLRATLRTATGGRAA